MLLWTNSESSTLQNSSCTATYLPSHKLSNLDEQDTLGTGGEVRTNSSGMFSYGLPQADSAAWCNLT